MGGPVGETSWGPLLLLATVGLALVNAQEIVFPGSTNPNNRNAETCTLPSGVAGTCKLINECPVVAQNVVTNPPKHCGFKGRIPIVCCPTPKDPIRVIDISPPINYFECGKEYVKWVPIVLIEEEVSDPRPVPIADGNFRRKRNLPDPGFLDPRPQPIRPTTPPTLPECEFEWNPTDHDSIDGSVVKKNAYPWMALLGESKDGEHIWSCSGVLLNRRWVLTAAHCTNIMNATATVVRLGEHDFTKDHEVDHEDVGAAEIIYHPGYKLPEAYHDLSLVRLATPIKIRREISPICLPWGKEADLPVEGENVTVSGWGTTSHYGDKLSPFLNEIQITVGPTDVCANSYSTLSDFTPNYPQSLGEETLCIGDNSNGTRVKDSCPGDSGGPAVLQNMELLGHNRYTLVGIVSKGYGCGKRDFPGIYVAIQHPEHLAWIKKVAFSNTYESACSPECIHGGCIGLNSCQCDDWWEGDQCQQPICSKGCGFGKCVEIETCQCDDGWSSYYIGGKCDEPVCEGGCCWGHCTSPNNCTSRGLPGAREDSDPCINGYFNRNRLCTCYDGWTGELCNIAAPKRIE